jgi:glycerol-3-phosphate acyltransferase PlsY
MHAALLAAAAYLCGSVPTGLLAGRSAGVDVRRTGSGNIGATNVARTAGARAAAMTLVGDVAKGLLPCVLARFLLTGPWEIALVGCAAFFGHVFSVFLRFSGGKGVATGFGVFLGLAPLAAVVSAIIFAIAAFTTRYVSLASILAAGVLPLATSELHYSDASVCSAIAVAVTIIVRHRQNLSRLRRGAEPKFEIST